MLIVDRRTHTVVNDSNSPEPLDDGRQREGENRSYVGEENEAVDCFGHERDGNAE